MDPFISGPRAQSSSEKAQGRWTPAHAGVLTLRNPKGPTMSCWKIVFFGAVSGHLKLIGMNFIAAGLNAIAPKPNQIRRGRWGREGGRRGSDTITAERDLERAGGESSVTVRPCPPLAATCIHPGGGWRGRRSPTWRATVACYPVAAPSQNRPIFPVLTQCNRIQ